MTETEYVALKATLVQGGITERINLICPMSPDRLMRFIDRIELPYCEPLARETWRLLARTAACRIRDLQEQIEALTACSDRHNPDCACGGCEAVLVTGEAVGRPANTQWSL